MILQNAGFNSQQRLVEEDKMIEVKPNLSLTKLFVED